MLSFVFIFEVFLFIDKEPTPGKKSMYQTQMKIHPGINRGALNQQHPQYEHYPRSYPQNQAQYLEQYTNNIKDNQKKTNQLVPLSVSADRLVSIYSIT
jgi:hypothetical protein